MGKIDTYYRAFKEYRKETKEDKGCIRDRTSYMKSNIELDKLEVTKFLCTIDSEWIEKIEKGLEYVEKACKEERQFIRTDGETVPIEKAKKVSKSSVEHLARHSNMITHVPDDDSNLVPDEIYLVEKLNDYAVYENRFLYLLLCYLRDFISLRLEKIERLRRTYYCDFILKKSVESKYNNINYDMSFHQEKFDNPYYIMDNSLNSLMQRINDCQQIVIMLLNTNLMNEVSKVAMIKPPIIKTNVLKMNNNFKNSLALYDYIVNYNGLGYSYQEVKRTYSPFNNILVDEMGEICALTEFLSYKAGNDLEDLLGANYKEEEERKKALEAKALLAQLERLKKQVSESGVGIEEYMLLLEKKIKMLEKDSQELLIVKNEVISLNKTIVNLKLEIQELRRRIQELEKLIAEKDSEIAALNQKYIDDMAMIKKSHQEDIAQIHLDYQKKHEDFLVEVEKAIADAVAENSKKLEETITAHVEKINSLENERKELVNSLSEGKAKYEERINSIEQESASAIKERDLLMAEAEAKCKMQIEEINKINEVLNDEKNLAIAELDAIRIQNGEVTPTVDFTSKERFDQLETEFLAFDKFFKAQWKMTKKEIRKRLWKK